MLGLVLLPISDCSQESFFRMQKSLLSIFEELNKKNWFFHLELILFYEFFEGIHKLKQKAILSYEDSK